MNRILVLLPVYNGEKYLAEQIDSILAQTHRDLLLVCRDDGSTDASLALLQDYAQRYPDQVIVLQDGKGNLGASGSFSALMQWALANYGEQTDAFVALADQDDIWHLNKLETCLQALLGTQVESPLVPVLVHSDLRVVTAEGEEISPSLMQFQGLDPARTWFAAQLISNTVTGCTSLMNMALLKKALPVPADAVMHDWWLSLVASAFGRLVFVPQALVEYRQHGRNTLGAREHKKASLNLLTFKKLFQLKQNPEAQKLFEDAAAQARAFEVRFETELDQKDRGIVADVKRLPQLGLWQQRLLFRKLRSV